ncbi:thiamin pyrophosphokinase 1-like isoform X2 [Sycon ciliatum]|uniref:thiamin pyrophosphokinase 1-like isoform X2 n=1 Tax=Sycon ciliatum TaxID=27933 RepID=UPI0031F6693C
MFSVICGITPTSRFLLMEQLTVWLHALETLILSMTSMVCAVYVPDIVCGDFDSADEELLDHHRSTQGVAVHHTPDQNYTDFHKSLQVLVTHMSVHPQSKVDEVFVLGAFGGRVDQYFANVNVLHSVQATVPLPIYLLDDINLTWLLRSGQHIIDVCSGLEGDWCGLVPVGSTCESVTTSGLHWDLEGDRMEFGGLISTSNRLATPTPHSVSVSCSHALLWCIGINTSSISRGEQSST